MVEDFLSAFLGNPARTKLVRVFIFNQGAQGQPLTLAQISKRSGTNTQVAGREIKNLEKIGIVKKVKTPAKQSKKTLKTAKRKTINSTARNEITWVIDSEFKHLRALSSFVHEVSPVRYENIINALKNSGRLATVVVSGCFMGDSTRPVDIIIVAENLNEARLLHAIQSLETSFGREIRYASFSPTEFSYRLTIQDRLIRDTLDYPHKIILDRARLL